MEAEEKTKKEAPFFLGGALLGYNLKHKITHRHNFKLYTTQIY